MRAPAVLAFAVVVFASLAVAPAVFAEEWPQFRGPTGQGHSTETGLPLNWSDTQNVRWKTAVPGRGWSSPVVVGGRVWLTTATRDGGGSTLRALAYDAGSGKELVNAEVFSLANAGAMHAKNSHASPTPLVEDQRVYVHFGNHGTAALDWSGKVLWKRQIPYQPVHGTGGSPVLSGDLLIYSADGGDTQFVIALDKRTGEVRWKSARPKPGGMAFSTPLVIDAGGRKQLVSTGAHRAISYEPETGKEIWRVEYGDGFSNVPRPVYGHGLVYLLSGFYTPQLMAVRPEGKGDVTKTEVAWQTTRSTPLTPSPLLVGGELYMISDNGIASCLDAKTGKLHWQQRLGGNHSASPIYADGRVYFLSEEGDATVIAPGKTFQKLATNSMNAQTFASIAVSGGSFYVRTAEALYRIGGR